MKLGTCEVIQKFKCRKYYSIYSMLIIFAGQAAEDIDVDVTSIDPIQAFVSR